MSDDARADPPPRPPLRVVHRTETPGRAPDYLPDPTGPGLTLRRRPRPTAVPVPPPPDEP